MNSEFIINKMMSLWWLELPPRTTESVWSVHLLLSPKDFMRQRGLIWPIIINPGTKTTKVEVSKGTSRESNELAAGSSRPETCLDFQRQLRRAGKDRADRKQWCSRTWFSTPMPCRVHLSTGEVSKLGGPQARPLWAVDGVLCPLRHTQMGIQSVESGTSNPTLLFGAAISFVTVAKLFNFCVPQFPHL